MLTYNKIRRAHVELSSYCNLACPACPRTVDGGIRVPNFISNSLSLADFKKIFPQNLLQQMTDLLFCGNYGDPMMCKEVLEILYYIRECNNSMRITFSTHGGIRSVKFWQELGNLKKDLPKLKVRFCIDGLEDTNHIYRVGIEWNKLIENASNFINSGGQAEWDFLVFRHNQHQVNDAKMLASKMGFDKFIPTNPHGFKYNGKMRVVDKNGEFVRLLERNSVMQQPKDEDYNFNDIEYNYNKTQVEDMFNQILIESTDSTNKIHHNIIEKFNSRDNIQIKNCICKDSKEIYIDSSGGVHPCCYLGHISQQSLPIHELVMHKSWVENTVGLENINALNRSLQDIVDSDYFSLIEKSWSLTAAEGKNPMCVFKCGIQRPNKFIKT
jgi:MoaA/NifB/PqqE/SkfB family radical SAM enzyme